MITSMRLQKPANASSTLLSTTSNTRWWRPRLPVLPTYIPGRFLTPQDPPKPECGAHRTLLGPCGVCPPCSDSVPRAFPLHKEGMALAPRLPCSTRLSSSYLLIIPVLSGTRQRSETRINTHSSPH